MPSLQIATAKRFEQLVAEHFKLDPSQIVAGSISVDVRGGDDFETVEWTGTARVPRGFMREMFERASRVEP